MNAFSGAGYQIAATEIDYRIDSKVRFQKIIRIDDFRSFAKANAKYDTKRVAVHDTEWFISVELCNYSEADKRYITHKPLSSDHAEFLGIYIIGDASANEAPNILFVLDTIIKFKRKLLSKKCLFFLNPVEEKKKQDGFQIKIDVFNFTAAYILLMCCKVLGASQRTQWLSVDGELTRNAHRILNS